ncbi:MAG: nucleotide exchange factor GrpE [Butyrivibrio sp.]|nr:nucleotide exchange factor GrpE [Butyrivibrio sp.]
MTEEMESNIFQEALKDHEEIKEKVNYLQDLFVRRLNEDKQKTEMIRQLQELSTFAVIEPFLSDMALILDRINGSEDDFTKSIGEELYDALNRRGFERIDITGKFNPALHKAVRIIEDDSVDDLSIVQVSRNGYIFNGKVIRFAEVVIAAQRNKERKS